MDNEVKVGLELLTDDAIADYSRSDGKDRVLFDHRDLNLRFDNVHPVPGGAYDTDIFGSPFADRCVCGKIRQASSEPCPNCGARVFTKEEGLRRFARIELPFYYLNELRLEIFQNFIDDVFKDSKIETQFIGDPKRNGFTTGRGSKFGMKVYDSCQFEYNPKNKTLYVKEMIDDEEKCSYEGLMKIIKEHFPDRLTEYMKLINHYYLVQPAMMRPFTLAYKDGKRLMGSHKLTIWYCVIIRLCCVEDKKSNDLNYEEVMSKFKTPGERVRYTALLRAFLNTGKKEATELLNTSKKNLARDLYSVRTKNSARCPIVPSTTNAIDEITVPRHLAYEMCREGFIKYLQDKINFTYDEAKKLTKLEALNPETQKLFEEYAEQQVVLVNRQPSLHEYSIFAMKLRLTDDSAIKFPLAACEPLNADFDGDTIQIQLIPESAREDTLLKMSPRYVNVYKKNNQPIFPFNHETLNGLAVATEYVVDDPEELKSPRYYYTDYVSLLKDAEVKKVIKPGTPIVYTGKIGSVEYQSKITSYGRIRISKILDADLDYLPILDDPMKRIDAKAATKLSMYLNGQEDGVEKRKELQKFALMVVTLAGNVTFDYKTLYVNTNTKTYQEICKIADAPDLTDQQKLALLTKKYQEYEKEVESEFSKDLKNELNMAGRVKISSISALNSAQLILSGVDEKPVITRGSLLSGYTEKDFIFHAVENRSLQSIKQSGVPSSGYLTRQISFLLNNYIYQDGEDLDNPGLLIPRYKALGRTAPNGKVYPDTPLARPNEDDLVPVRSIVTKRKGDLNVVTSDLIGKKFKDFTPGAAIGLSFATSFTESTTQGALGLKHGGHERILNEEGYLYAPRPCTFREEGRWIYLKVRGGELKYPRPDNLVTLAKDKFEKDEPVCCAYTTTSPIYKLNALIKLMQAMPSKGKRYFEKDDVITSDCYAYNDGTIRYEETPEGNIRVFIGETEYQYNPLCIYYFPEGAEVRKFDRICSGVINMTQAARVLGPTRYNDIYLIFRKQLYTLTDPGFIKTGASSLSSTQEEIIELLFTGLTKTSFNAKDLALEEVDYMGSQKSILNKRSFYTVLSFGYSSKIVDKAIKGEVDLEGDVMTNAILGLLLSNKLDN